MKKKNKVITESAPMGGRSIGNLLNVNYEKDKKELNMSKSVEPKKDNSKLKTIFELWLSKKGRGNNPVTLLKGITRLSDRELNSLLKNLKQKIACGGSFKVGELLVQSTDREKIKSTLQKLGYGSKICGG